MTIGMLGGSTFGGRRLSRTGRYRWYPVIGCALMNFGTIMLAAMDRSTSKFETSAFMFIYGVGAGFVFIVVLVGVQNKVAHEDLGIATSAINFFRSLGNTLGTAIFGPVFIAQLDNQLARRPRRGAGSSADTFHESPTQIRQFEPILRDNVIQSFTDALHYVFLFTAPFCLIAFALSSFIPEHPFTQSSAIGGADDKTEGDTTDGGMAPLPAH